MNNVSHDLLADLSYYKKLWKAAVPECVDTPSDQIFMLWIGLGIGRISIQNSILKTGKRMLMNNEQNIPTHKDDAAKYCASLIRSWKNSQDKRNIHKSVSTEGGAA
jgi:hypothetical protein